MRSGRIWLKSGPGPNSRALSVICDPGGYQPSGMKGGVSAFLDGMGGKATSSLSNGVGFGVRLNSTVRMQGVWQNRQEEAHNLAEGLLAHGGGAVLDLEEKLHDPPFVRLVLFRSST